MSWDITPEVEYRRCTVEYRPQLEAPLFCCESLSLRRTINPCTGSNDPLSILSEDLAEAVSEGRFQPLRFSDLLGGPSQEILNPRPYIISVLTPASDSVLETIVLPPVHDGGTFVELDSVDGELARSEYRKSIEEFGELECRGHGKIWTLFFYRRKDGSLDDELEIDEDEKQVRLWRAAEHFSRVIIGEIDLNIERDLEK